VGGDVRLLVGDDGAEDHHDVEVLDAAGRRLARARLPEGVAGIARLPAIIGEPAGQDVEDEHVEVLVGIQTDRGPWVAALVAAGDQVFAVNPLQAARDRERPTVSGANSDPGDAHVLADMVGTDAHQVRPVASDSAQAEAVKVVARTHKTLLWERTRHPQRRRHALGDSFPAAVQALEDLDAPDALALLAKAPDPASAARLPRAQIRAALRRARRRHVGATTERIWAVLHAGQLGQPEVVTGADAASVGSLVAVLGVLDQQIATLQGQVVAHFGRHPDAGILASPPGLGQVLGARVLAEFDDPTRYATARARTNDAGTSPITRRSGTTKLVAARCVHNDRLIDALMTQAFAALRASPGARASYDQLRARGAGHNAALRQLANRLVGILHGCLKTRTRDDQATVWSHHPKTLAA
jgi:transposase